MGKYFDSETRWLNEKEFAAGYRIINAADLSSLQLQVSNTPKKDIADLEVLRGARRVYLLPTRDTAGVDVLSGDPAYPYGFDAFEAKGAKIPPYTEETYQLLRESFPETEFVVVNPWYFQPLADIRNPAIIPPNEKIAAKRSYSQHDFPSPDGRFYARNTDKQLGTNIEIYQCGKKLVAQTLKPGWYMLPKGWAEDGHSFYALLRPPAGYIVNGDVPMSVVKLNLPPEVLANAPAYKGEGFCE